MALMCKLVGHNWQRVSDPIGEGPPYRLCPRCAARCGVGSVD